MFLSHRAVRTHLDAPSTPSISFAAVVPARSRLDFGRPVRLVRLRPGALPQTLRTPPHDGRPVLGGQHWGLSGEKRPTRRRPVGTRCSPRLFPWPEHISCHRRSSSVAPPLVSSNTSHARRGITPAFGYGSRLENGPTGLSPARNMRRLARTTTPSDSRCAPLDFTIGLYERSLLTRLRRRASPVPNQAVRTCRSPYPGRTRPRACPDRQ
jgi:hypothetical protein